MPEPEPPAAPSFQVLADPTGRRRRRLVIAGRVATAVLGLWLVVLILGGLGLQPLAGLPVVGDLGAGGVAPPALPERVQTAVAKHTTVAPATAPGRTNTIPGRGPRSPAPSHPTTRPSTTAPGQTRTPPGQTKTGPGPPASTPGTTPGGNGKGNVPGADGKAKTR